MSRRAIRHVLVRLVERYGNHAVGNFTLPVLLDRPVPPGQRRKRMCP